MDLNDLDARTLALAIYEELLAGSRRRDGSGGRGAYIDGLETEERPEPNVDDVTIDGSVDLVDLARGLLTRGYAPPIMRRTPGTLSQSPGRLRAELRVKRTSWPNPHIGDLLKMETDAAPNACERWQVCEDPVDLGECWKIVVQADHEVAASGVADKGGPS